MKIAVVTCTTDNRKWLYDLTNPTKEKYCKKYNVDYIFRTDVYYDKDYLPGWNKILFILEYLNKYDYVMWMDDDAGFIKQDFDIFEYCISNLQDKSIIICKDLAGLNSGVMFIKSNDFTKNIFKEIWEHRSLYKTNHHGHPGVMEQPAIIDMCNIFTNEVVIGDGKILNSYDKCYITSKPNQRTNESVILHIAAGRFWKENHKDLIRRLYANL